MEDEERELAEGALLEVSYERLVTDMRQVVGEVLAFLRAASTDRAVLLYPADAEEPPAPVGTVTQFEAITVDTMTVIGAKVAVQGLGRSKGLASFASNVGQWLTSTA